MLLSDAADFLRRLPKRAWSGSSTEVAGRLCMLAGIVSNMSRM
jgi:hypothetical protein